MQTPDPRNNVLFFDDVVALRERARGEGRRFVLTNGCFDLLHRGHLSYLHASAATGDLLVVAVNSDESVRQLKGPGRPWIHECDRAYAVASLRFVDAAFIFPGPRLTNEIALLRPDVYTKAGDYTLATLDPAERAALEQAGTRIEILPFVEGHSTTRLISGIRRATQPDP